MGYTLKIGELKTEWDDSDGIESRIHNCAEGVHHDNAPAFGEPTDGENSRWPSYSAWHNFTRFVDLEDLFYNKDTGLLREHPGCFPLVKEHKEIIDKAYKAFYEKYPNCKAGFSPNVKDIFSEEDKSWPEENTWAVRLEWLKYWVDWSLKNCKHPVFYNS
jgi:hypothetical protein